VADVGENFTEIVQLALAARLAPHVVDDTEKFAPVCGAMDVIVRLEDPVLERVTT